MLNTENEIAHAFIKSVRDRLDAETLKAIDIRNGLSAFAGKCATSLLLNEEASLLMGAAFRNVTGREAPFHTGNELDSARFSNSWVLAKVYGYASPDLENKNTSDLTDELDRFYAHFGITPMCALEAYHSDLPLTEFQKDYLLNFIERWEKTQDVEDRAFMALSS